MKEPQSKDEMLALVLGERSALEKVLASLSEDEMLIPGVEGDWSVKDLLAHIVDWEQRMAKWLQETLKGEVPVRPEPGLTWDDLDVLNARTYQANKDRPLAEVLEDFRRSFQQALLNVDRASEEQYFDPQHFAWREGDPLWHVVAANTWWHYRDHCEVIEGWKRSRQ